MRYQLRESKPAFLTMPVEKRAGKLPRHGYGSGKSAGKYGEAMELGNGCMSVAVYGDPYEERVIYGQERLYLPLMKEVPPPPPLAGHLDEIRRLIREGKSRQAADFASDIAREEGGHKGLLIKPEDPNAWEMPLEGFLRHSAARLCICLKEDEALEDYLRTVDFMRGEACVYWTDSRGEWCRRGFVSRPDTMFYHQIRIPDGVETELTLQLEPFEESGEHSWERRSLPKEVLREARIRGSELLMEGWYDETVSPEGYVAAVRIQGDAVTVCDASAEGECCRIRVKARGVITILSTVRHYERFVRGCGNEVAEELAHASDDYEAKMEQNLASHGKLMQASVLETAEAADVLLTIEELLQKQHLGQRIHPLLLEKYYDAGRFFQIITTGELPPMIGQWNINVNLQVSGANMTGLQELMLPYFDFIEKNLPDFRRNAREIYGCRGILADIHPDMHNGILYHFSRTWPHQFFTAGTGWMYHEFYYYYLTTGDQEFLRQHVVPGLREIAEFYSDFLKDKDADGNYMFYPCLSPENSPMGQGPASINAGMDIMVCREVLENLLSALDILGMEEPLRERCEEILGHLPVLLTDEEGGLKEWAWAGHGENYDHRCVSHHYDVWPGDKINPEDTPGLARAVWISNRKRSLENDSCHGIMHRLLCAIRLGDKALTGKLLGMLFEAGFVNSNMSTNHYPYRVVFPDMLGGMPAVVGELLVSSRPGRIQFLPGAEGVLNAGAVRGMRLYTLVSLERMEWDLKAGRFLAEIVFLEDQEVTIGLGAWPDISDQTVQRVLETIRVKGCRGQRMCIEQRNGKLQGRFL